LLASRVLVNIPQDEESQRARPRGGEEKDMGDSEQDLEVGEEQAEGVAGGQKAMMKEGDLQLAEGEASKVAGGRNPVVRLEAEEAQPPL
jgi:hypothetical protein